MRITSIISEYNPFHEGHKYHMENAKKITNSDYAIVIMSGNFTQRGTPAIINKYARTKQALLNGADLVLELPVCFATASAEGFAFGAVSVLDKLNVADSLVFGSECGDIECIKNIADYLVSEPFEYKERLQLYLKQGLSFPKARANALHEVLPNIDKALMSSSNNILGIEYCRALKHFNSSIQPMTIARKDNLYNDTDLAETGKLSSATAIRKTLLDASFKSASYTQNNFYSQVLSENSTIFQALTSHMPENSLDILKEHWGSCAPISSKDFSLLLKYKLLSETRESLVQYLDVTSDLADRIYNNLNFYTDFDSFCDLLKTKELTYTRIARSLIHILLDIKKDTYEHVKDVGYGQYTRILGFRKEASSLLHEIKKSSSIPLISKLSDFIKISDATALSLLKKDIQAAHIYESVVANKFGQEFRNEFQRQLVII